MPRHLVLRRLVIALAVAVLVLPLEASAQAQPSFPGLGRPTNPELTSTRAGGKDWITYGGSLFNQRYSTLNQINQSNVANLKGAWMTRLNSGRGSKYKFEADPLVIDGVMYIPTGNDDIFALDAKTGRKLWEYFSDIPQTNEAICCGWDNRGVGVGEGMVFSGQLDGSLVALDQTTGKIAWRVQLEDYREGYSITGATRYYDGIVFTGMSGGERGIRGRVYGLDAKTGKELWRFYTVPGPGEIGSETWPMNDPDPIKANIYLRGGATVWQAPAIDPELGMMYFSTGNASPWEGTLRPGDSLFTASIVALDYKTGQYKWHFQQVRHEIWDFDMPNPVVLFDQVYNGVPRKGLYEAGKTGWLYFLDRTNGEPLIGMEYRPVPQEPRQFTADTQPYPVGDAFVDQCAEPNPAFPLQGCIFTPYWDVPVLNRPLGGGGANWHPTTYHPPTGYVFVTGNEQNGAYAVNLYAPKEYEPGKSFSRTSSATAIGSTIKSTLTAMDSRTNKIVWQKRQDFERNYGTMSTAGDLLFTGQVDGLFKAYDVRTGDELWSFQLGWGVSAPAMTYEIDGVQYVAIAAGGNRGGVTTLDGDAVWSFSLNGTLDQLPAPPKPVSKVEISGTPVRLGGEVGNPVTALGGTWIFEGTVRTLDFRFDPPRIQIPVGTTINWENQGSTIHTATGQKGEFDSGDLPAGGVYSKTFDTPGSIIYLCTPHPWMIGEVVVQ
jgi:quinohemoprotein ethanol dehydrogenase